MERGRRNSQGCLYMLRYRASVDSVSLDEQTHRTGRGVAGAHRTGVLQRIASTLGTGAVPRRP